MAVSINFEPTHVNPSRNLMQVGPISVHGGGAGGGDYWTRGMIRVGDLCPLIRSVQRYKTVSRWLKPYENDYLNGKGLASK